MKSNGKFRIPYLRWNRMPGAGVGGPPAGWSWSKLTCRVYNVKAPGYVLVAMMLLAAE